MLKVRYNGQQKVATFFATLLQNELNTVGMLRFIPPTFKPALQQNQVVCRLRKVVAESRVLPAKGKLVL